MNMQRMFGERLAREVESGRISRDKRDELRMSAVWAMMADAQAGIAQAAMALVQLEPSEPRDREIMDGLEKATAVLGQFMGDLMTIEGAYKSAPFEDGPMK